MIRKIFFLAGMLVYAAVYSWGQPVNPQAPLQLDGSVRYGKLDNGLAYYIKQNEKPAQRADFYLVTAVGAVQETPAQDGLAHFLEHMCLNGTKNFPGKGIISYMESIGAKFGENINAATGVETTSYMLNNIPVTREGIVDSSLLILHDYAAYVTNDPREIEAERGVILEEKRTRNTSDWRFRDAVVAALFRGTKMAECSLIGSEENLKNFKPEELVKFYKTWYRPDLQAVIVVGDVDVDRTEEKIRDLFGDIPAAANPRQKEIIKVPENAEPIITVFTDKENSTTGVDLYFKSEPLPREYRPLGISVLTGLYKDLISEMMSERLQDMARKPDAPFLGASAGFSSLSQTLEAFAAHVRAKDGEGVPAFTALVTELERAAKYGFTRDEFDRAKTNLLRAYERHSENAGSRLNSELVQEYISHFIDNEPYLTPAYLNEAVKGYMELITLDSLNRLMNRAVTDDNIVILYSSPEREGLAVPMEKDLLEAITRAKEADIRPAEESNPLEPLLDTAVLKGSPVTKTSEGKFGTTLWTLTNGIQVIIKPTRFKKDEVLVHTVGNGGSSIVPEELMPSLERNVFQVYLQNAGISGFNSIQLSKMLTGKVARAAPYIGSLEQGVDASGSPKDLETLFQLLYLYYTAPRFEENEFAVGMNQLKAIVPNMENQPEFAFQTRVQEALSAGDPRKPVLTAAMLDKVNIHDLKKAYQMLFSDAAGTKVFITGSVDLEQLQPLVEKYIGSLPVLSEKGNMWTDHNIEMAGGFIEDTFRVEMTAPKTSVALVYNGAMESNLKNDILMAALSHVLDMLYTKTIREEEGGTYGVGVMGQISQLPKERFVFLINFDTDVRKAPQMIKLAKSGFASVASEGPPEEYVAKAKESLLKTFPEQQIRNPFWLSVIVQYYTRGADRYSEYENAVKESVTRQEIRKFAKRILDAHNRIDIVMNPRQ